MDEYIIHFNRREKTPPIQAIEDAIRDFKAASEEEIGEKGIAVLEAIRFAVTQEEDIKHIHSRRNPRKMFLSDVSQGQTF